jgi:hypothetical protein
MTTDERIAALEERFQPLRDRVDRTFAELDEKEGFAITATKVVEIYASKARHVAMEALSEMRHIDEELKRLKAGSSTTASPGSRRAKARSRSRASRD